MDNEATEAMAAQDQIGWMSYNTVLLQMVMPGKNKEWCFDRRLGPGYA